MLAAAALVTALLAAGDWVAVQAGRRRIEYLCKPATMIGLVACALLLRPVSDVERTWFVAALIFGMVGDVLLMLPRDAFLPGLGAFLVGHLAYSAGFASGGQDRARILLAAVALAVAAAVVLPRLLRGARESGAARVVPALLVYVVVISLMVAAAFGSRQPVAVAPAALFMHSDALIAFRRFVSPRRWMPVAIMVTYHLAQAGLVAWLALK